MTRRFRPITLPLLGVVGIQGWLLILNGMWGKNAHVTLLAVAVAAALIPPVRRIAWKFLRKLRRPTARQRAIIAVLVTLAAGAALGHFAATCGRALYPTMQDEFQFLLQTRMLASGRLWMPAHPLLDFFDTFYVLIQPKYAAQSFPGTAILFVPSIWLGIVPWKWAIALAAITVGLFYRVVAELIDGLAGLLAASLLCGLSLFRYVSTMVLAQVPLMLLGLAAVWAYLHWRRKRNAKWAAALGFLGALTFITRPADSLVFGLPIALAMILDLRKHWTPTLKSLAPLAAGAAPCAALMLVFDFGVTGHWLMTPFQLYNQRDQPRLVYGFHIPDGNQQPLTRILEKRQYYDSGTSWRLSQHKPSLFWHSFTSERFPVTMNNVLPQPMLGALLPMGLLAWRRKRAWLLAAGLPLFFLVYTPYPIFTAHYTVIAAPSAIVGILLGFKAIAVCFPRSRAGVWTAAAIFIGGMLITPSIDQLSMSAAVSFRNSPGNGVLSDANKIDSDQTAKGERALILFRRDPTLSMECEPVYNIQTAWPDDAMVIRAHDRGPDNWQIFQYYASRDSERRVYLFDESKVAGPLDGPDGPLSFLGTVGELTRSVSAPTTSIGH
jgi:hypothetical protein